MMNKLEMLEMVKKSVTDGINKSLKGMRSVELATDKCVQEDNPVNNLYEKLQAIGLSDDIRNAVERLVAEYERSVRNCYSSVTACQERLIEARAHAEMVNESFVAMSAAEDQVEALIKAIEGEGNE